ncbi:hypothetical protein KEM60_00357 [Austwickia sp. TVS 96-490-7B]|nr:hypothetical protein [Austwickia sp. TVS 96-490-7B]
MLTDVHHGEDAGLFLCEQAPFIKARHSCSRLLQQDGSVIGTGSLTLVRQDK